MKKNVVLLALVIAAASVTASAQAPQGQRRPQQAAASESTAKKLTRAEFDALLKNPAGVLVLDVRRPDEIQSIGGFPAYLSIQAADLEKYLAFIPKDRAIVPVSNHAARAGRAAGILEKHGFKVAGVIGAQDYEGEGGTLLKIVPPAPRADSRQ
jgi:rhodanese-related sulfurtransferase